MKSYMARLPDNPFGEYVYRGPRQVVIRAETAIEARAKAADFLNYPAEQIEILEFDVGGSEPGQMA